MIFITKIKALLLPLPSVKALNNNGYSDQIWCRDPLSHPDIEAMSERALADLPFDPGTIISE